MASNSALGTTIMGFLVECLINRLLELSVRE
jgi:hypothetical protein